MADGLYQSAVVFFIPYAAWTLGNVVSWNGKTIESLADFGTTVSVAAIFSANTYVGLNTRYWTFLTWIVVVGSSVVMLLWIVTYSFFQSSDFNDEVVILFGNVPFWACVVVSVVIALAPRFLVKFVSTSYLPLDRDIVREMWVYGDLKDRLGIKHRRNRKRADIEGTPMFHQPHARSHSEVSVVYESGTTSTTQRYSDPPPETSQRTRSPPSQPAESWALRQRIPSNTTSPTTTVGPSSMVAYAQASTTSPGQTSQSIPVSSYEMQIRHNQELTDSSYQSAEEDWVLEPRPGTLTPSNRYSPGQAL